MKLTKTKEETIKYEDYSINYENGVVCYVQKQNDVIVNYYFLTKEKKLTYVKDITPFTNTHWSKHYDILKEKEFEFEELQKFNEFDKLFYIGSGRDGMLMNVNLVPISTPIVLDEVFFAVWEKIETSKEECQLILDSLKHEYIISSEIKYIPYYNQNEDCENHYTLNLMIKLPQEDYVRILGKEKHVHDTIKKEMFNFLKK